MPSLEEIGEPTDAEKEVAETAIEAINGSDRLGIVPFVDKESDDRVLFLVAIRETDKLSGDFVRFRVSTKAERGALMRELQKSFAKP